MFTHPRGGRDEAQPNCRGHLDLLVSWPPRSRKLIDIIDPTASLTMAAGSEFPKPSVKYMPHSFYSFVSRTPLPPQQRGAVALQSVINQQVGRVQERNQAAQRILQVWRAYHYRPGGPVYQASQAHFEGLCRESHQVKP
jgi:hypothetical protein